MRLSSLELLTEKPATLVVGGSVFAINEHREDIEEEIEEEIREGIREDREDTWREYNENLQNANLCSDFNQPKFGAVKVSVLASFSKGANRHLRNSYTRDYKCYEVTKIDCYTEVLLTSNFMTDKYWYGKCGFPRIQQPKFWGFKI